MSHSNSAATLEAAKDSSSSTAPHMSVRKPTPEGEVDRAATFGQRAVTAVGGNSLQTPPTHFASLLGHARGSPSTQAAVLRQLQRRYGNSYVGEVIQAKLSINQPGDVYEQEADRVAEQVMRMPGPAVQRKCAACEAGLLCTTCTAGQNRRIHRKTEPGGHVASQSALEGTLKNLGPGRPLDASTRAIFEPQFGRDFSQVRVHTDSKAGHAAVQLKAQAFTSGRDIYFGEGHYQPETPQGKRLLAHELTHVLQQDREGSNVIHRQVISNVTQMSITEDWAKTLDDTELVDQTLLARGYLQTLAPASLEYDQARQTLSLLTAEVEHRHREVSIGLSEPGTFAESLPTGSRMVSLAPPEGETITFEGVILADNADYVRYQLEELVRKHGRSALDKFPSSFEAEKIARVQHEHSTRVGSHRARIDEILEETKRAKRFEEEYHRYHGQVPAGVPENPMQYAEREEKIASIEEEIASMERGLEEELRLPRAIGNHLRTQAQDITAEIETLFWQFSSRSELITKTLLDESKRRVEAERVRYGIEREIHVIPGDWAMQDPGQVHTDYSMEETLSSRGLAGTAQDLAEKKEHIENLARQRRRLVRTTYMRGDRIQHITDQAEYDRLGTEIEEARREYEIARGSAETRYPVLATYAEESGTRSLSRIAEDPRWQGRAETVGAVIYDRLEKIQRVRHGLASGEVDPWTLPEIVTLTLAEMGVRPDTMYERVIRDEAARRSEKSIWDWILAGIALVLGIIAAIPTGGSSLAVAVSATAALASVGISGYMLAEHIKEYQLESAKAGTDFDRARSISQDDPSAFWLALDIAFFVVDLGAAAQAFRRLAPLARQALGTGTEAVQSMRVLRNAADDIDPRLGARIMANLQRLRGGGDEALEVAGAAGRHEAEALTRAGRELAEEAAETIGTVITSNARHTVKLTRSGHLVICTSCRWIRDVYFGVLAENYNLKRRLDALETLSETAAAMPRGAAKTALNRRIAIRTRMLLRDLEAEELGKLHWAGDLIEEGPLEGLSIVDVADLRLSRSEADLARDLFNEVIRPRYREALGVLPGSGGQIHHAIEIQALWRYPGVLTEAEINAFASLRGIPPELAGRMQFHNSAIRRAWNRHYARLDEALDARPDLVPGTPDYDTFVRDWITDARREIDWMYGAFYTQETRALQSFD